MGIWDSIRLTVAKFKKVKKSVIRIKVIPAPEHTILFVRMMSAQAAPSGGGGGDSNDPSWGCDKDEDELEWVRRCAREAARRIGKKPKTGR